MTRLLAAILILFAVLIGLKASNPSLLQNNLFGQSSSATPPTRNTGFSSEETGTTVNNGSVSAASFNAPNASNATNTTSTGNQVGSAANTTPLPPGTQPAVQARW